MLYRFLCVFLLTPTVFSYGGLTFKNVMVTCGNDNEDLDFVTTVTANSLKPHLPSECSKIEIKHSNIPVLYEGSLANISNVNILLLENNKIDFIDPKAFSNLQVKEGMSLKFNRLTSIRKGVFNGVGISVLYLSYNQISRIDPDAFDDMTELKGLHLDNNKIYYIDSNWFKNTPKLRKLVFRNNEIRSVPRFAFQNLPMGKFTAPSVDLSYNFITWVDRAALKRPQTWSKFNYMSLAHNQIQDFNSGWLDDVEVASLDISDNRIRCLSRGLSGNNSVNYVDGNPWICSCFINLKNLVESESGQIVAEETSRRCIL